MANWTLDPAHSQVEFSVKHMMITTVRGRFDSFTAELNFDEANPAASSVVAHIDAGSINTGMEARDAHLRSADFFDTATYPEIVFRSTKIEGKGDEYKLTGELTIRGETRPVTLEAEVEGVVPNWQGGGRRASFSAATKISRKDWGLTWNVALESGGWLVGDEIKVSIDLAFVEAAQEAVAQEQAEEASDPEAVAAR